MDNAIIYKYYYIISVTPHTHITHTHHTYTTHETLIGTCTTRLYVHSCVTCAFSDYVTSFSYMMLVCKTCACTCIPPVMAGTVCDFLNISHWHLQYMYINLFIYLETSITSTHVVLYTSLTVPFFLSLSPCICPFPVPNISFAFYKPGFFSKLIESHQVMAEVSTCMKLRVQLGFVSIKLRQFHWIYFSY